MAEILDIATFEVVPIGDIVYGTDDYDLNLDMIKIPDGDFEFPHPKANDIQMESYYFIVNMGTLLFAFIGSFMFPLIMYFLLKPCVKRFKKIGKKHH